DNHVIDVIHSRSNGNAFFAEELLVAARERATALPPTLRAVLLVRFMDLGTDAQELLRVASAGGQRVELRLLASVIEMDERRLDAALRETVAGQILVPDMRSEQERYAFRHE